MALNGAQTVTHTQNVAHSRILLSSRPHRATRVVRDVYAQVCVDPRDRLRDAGMPGSHANAPRVFPVPNP